MSNILLAGAILMVISLIIGTLYGNKGLGLHDNGADLLSYLMCGAGLGCVVVWFIDLLSYLMFGAGLGCVVVWFIDLLASALAP